MRCSQLAFIEGQVSAQSPTSSNWIKVALTWCWKVAKPWRLCNSATKGWSAGWCCCMGGGWANLSRRGNVESSHLTLEQVTQINKFSNCPFQTVQVSTDIVDWMQALFTITGLNKDSYSESSPTALFFYVRLTHIHSPMHSCSMNNCRCWRTMFFLTEMREAQVSCISRPLPPPPSLRGCHLLARAALKLSGSKSCATKREGKSATFASLGTLEYHGRRHPSSSCKASFVSASCLCFFCRHRDSNRTLYTGPTSVHFWSPPSWWWMTFLH